MPHLPSLPEHAGLFDVFKQFPKGLKALFEFHDSFLRGADSDWSIQERETIAAFVSSVNQCQFCYGAHRAYALAFGLDAEQLTLMVSDLERTDLPEPLKATLRYVRKLTESPARMTPEDAQAVLDTGVTEAALYDAIVICGAFNMMNRIVEGTGVRPSASLLSPSEEDLARRRHHSYAEAGFKAGLIDSST